MIVPVGWRDDCYRTGKLHVVHQLATELSTCSRAEARSAQDFESQPSIDKSLTRSSPVASTKRKKSGGRRLMTAQARASAAHLRKIESAEESLRMMRAYVRANHRVGVRFMATPELLTAADFLKLLAIEPTLLRF